MKLFKKICIGLTALLLAASPILTHITNFQTVEAARKSKGKITLFKNDYVYNQAGNKIKLNVNHSYRVPSDFAVSPTGYLITDMKSDDLGDHRSSQPYYGTKKINGQKFYDLGHNYYVNEANVLKVKGRNVAQGTLTIKRDALVYTKAGKATGKKLRTNSVVKYQGKAKAATKTPKYFYYLRDVARYLQPQSIPTYKIKGKYFYSLGHNRYINAANVGYINGHLVRYNGTSTATVLKNTNSITVNYSEAKRKLKKGQKIKLDLAVIPYLSDGFDNYLYRLHGHPDEYVDATEIKLQRDLPVIDYRDLVYTYVMPVTDNSVELYDTSGKAIGKRIMKPAYSNLTVDGLMYLWVPGENKAELFYHCLNYSDDNVVDDSQPDPIQDPNSVHRTNNQKLSYGNNFIKVSDVKYISGLKIKALNTIAQAENGQKIATGADKQELLTLFNEGKDLAQNSAYHDLMSNYDCALRNASAMLRSDKATVTQVDEAVWYVKTAKKQLTTMSTPPGD
ncbi:SLAP domain-containing protein [Lactobacillus apis]|uniref:SLAP domain-containing protein n=1 Tax=Lactobacillus apis TaxID=303541 RepID=UPI002431F94B|nr:SLAP domain-containing protein [Lactobacillus apis]